MHTFFEAELPNLTWQHMWGWRRDARDSILPTYLCICSYCLINGDQIRRANPCGRRIGFSGSASATLPNPRGGTHRSQYFWDPSLWPDRLTWNNQIWRGSASKERHVLGLMPAAKWAGAPSPPNFWDPIYAHTVYDREQLNSAWWSHSG